MNIDKFINGYNKIQDVIDSKILINKRYEKGKSAVHIKIKKNISAVLFINKISNIKGIEIIVNKPKSVEESIEYLRVICYMTDTFTGIEQETRNSILEELNIINSNPIDNSKKIEEGPYIFQAYISDMLHIFISQKAVTIKKGDAK